MLSPLNQQRHNILLKMSSLSEEKAIDLNNSNMNRVAKTRMIFMIIFIFSVLLCIAIEYWITRLINKPLRAMQSLMKNAATGDLTVQGNYVSKDENRLLTYSFNTMIISLRNLIKDISENSLSLSAMSEELTASASIQEATYGTEK